MNMSDAIKEAYAHAPAEITYYDTLDILHASFSPSIKVVRSDIPLPTPQGEYSPCHFDFRLPELDGGVRGQLQVTVNFLPKAAQEQILAASLSRDPVTIRYRQYLGPDQNPDAELPIGLQVSSIEQVHNGITATALFPDLHSAFFPRRLMTTSIMPGAII